MSTPRITLVKTFIVVLCFIVIPSTAFALKVGDPAPLFSGNSTQGNIQLSDFKGNQNVVLALYFAIFTPVWADEVRAFQRDLEEFSKLDAQIIGVSADSMEKNIKFAAENGINFPLVSDDGKKIKKSYGRGRVTYLIDKSGIIRFIQKGVPNNQDFLHELRKLN